LLTRGDRFQFDAHQAEKVSAAKTAILADPFPNARCLASPTGTSGRLWGRGPICAIWKCGNRARACDASENHFATSL